MKYQRHKHEPLSFLIQEIQERKARLAAKEKAAAIKAKMVLEPESDSEIQAKTEHEPELVPAL